MTLNQMKFVSGFTQLYKKQNTVEKKNTNKELVFDETLMEDK